MSKHVPFHVTSGLPFERNITVTLPTGRTWWTTSGSFEVLSQIREAPDQASPLLLDLKQYITVVFTPPSNTVSINLKLDGEDTRLLKKSGYYDIIMSDTFQVDAYAFVILKGSVYRDTVVTSEREESI